MGNRDRINTSKHYDVKKDRGDSFKRVDKPANEKTKDSIVEVNEKTKDILLDRGDLVSKMHKDKLSKNKNDKDDMQRNSMKSDIIVPKKKTILDDKYFNQMFVAEKKRIREEYTIKLKSKNMNAKSNVKDSQLELKNSNSNQNNNGDKEISNENTNCIKAIKEIDTKEKIRKSPVINNKRAKNDATKVYKAVTFTEQKKCTPLKIKIPTESSRKAKAKAKTHNGSESKTSVKRKVEKNKDRYLSPLSADRESDSPTTEVAKWSPKYINKHTRPYYEAWVNTTLKAISKNTKKCKSNLDYENIIKTFQKLLDERPESPDLIYESDLDERYTGKIKINHR